ncbi:MAG: hypothetical protein M0T84_06370 [Betaproteobacteria bacterium]|nr:hypothetical protein [Betaproteobacteria bacterium]
MLESESGRIRLLTERDGPQLARQWVATTLALYREAVENPRSHASLPEYRPFFERAIREFETFLARN